jgi:pimeloyl-ACP methyl ester carboxylesterase
MIGLSEKIALILKRNLGGIEGMHKTICWQWGSAVIGLLFVLSTGQAFAAPSKTAKSELKPKVQCSSLSGWKIPASSFALPTSGATISTAELKPATTPPDKPADALPEYCEVSGAILPVDPKAPNINFQVVIPTVWNGKSIQIGGNQTDGFIPLLAALARDNAGSPIGPVMPPDSPFPIAQGYALYGSDSGHCCASPPSRRGPGRGGPTPSNEFLKVDEAYVNYAYAQIKKTHDAAMAILRQMYGVQSRTNYFAGESQGGREALEAATRYPEDYDGVVASVPLTYITGMLFERAFRLKVQAQPGAWIPRTKLPAIAKEVRRQCDALDGLEDGVVNNYVGCNRALDPKVHPDAFANIRCAGGADTGNDCLSDPQIATVNAFHAPFTFPFSLAGGDSYPGEETGAEDEKTNSWLLAPQAPDVDSMYAASGYLRLLTRIPDFNIATTDLSEHKDGVLFASNLMDAPTDLSKFLAKGGKLIIHTPADDYVTNAQGQMKYFEEVV